MNRSTIAIELELMVSTGRDVRSVALETLDFRLEGSLAHDIDGFSIENL